MNFENYHSKSWQDHATSPCVVADSFSLGLTLCENSFHLNQLAQLATHVFGEHLGKWNEGVCFLRKLSDHSKIPIEKEVKKAIECYIESLNLASEQENSLANFSVSDQIKILSISASALAAQTSPERAQAYFIKALEFAENSIEKDDPVNRILAITGNNVACGLEEKMERNDIENDLMILAAKTSRKFWQLAGGWQEIERAEYRLANTYFKASMFDESHHHAQNCLEICIANNAPALELFFGYECLALAEKAKSNQDGYQAAITQLKKEFEFLSLEDKSWCKNTLAKFM